MTDVFISYSRPDKARVESLAAALEAHGFNVWWDDRLKGGAEFARETEAELNKAAVILVVWSRASIDSHWVADEATVGREKGNLLPIVIDAVQPKIGFRQIQTIDCQNARMTDGDPAFDQLVASLRRQVDGAPAPAAPDQPPNAPSASTAPDRGARSIAVLPFANLSPDPEQEYFSDGIAEEILTRLSKLEGLDVAGRTSSFSFKGKNETLAAIAGHLGVANLLEGAVRKQGNKVRITAQLISAKDGFQKWSGQYDRSLDDIFAIQDEIASAISTELELRLGQDKRLRPDRPTQDDEAYQLFLKGRYIVRQRYGQNGGSAITHAIRLYEQALDRDDRFARAWSNLSLTHALSPQYIWRPTPDAYDDAKRCAAKASALDPSLGEHYAGLAVIEMYMRDYPTSLESSRRALQLEPQDAFVQRVAGASLLLYGLPRIGESAVRESVRIDPTSGMETAWLGEVALALRDIEAARRYAQSAVELGCNFANRVLAEVAAHDGKFDEAGMLFAKAMHLDHSKDLAPVADMARRAYERDPAVAEQVRNFMANRSSALAEFAIILLMKAGFHDSALALLEGGLTNHEDAILVEIWNPYDDGFRRSEAFAHWAKRYNLEKIWRQYGYPEGLQQA